MTGFHRLREDYPQTFMLHVGQHFHADPSIAQRRDCAARRSFCLLSLLRWSPPERRPSAPALCCFVKRLLTRGQFPLEIVLCLLFGIQLRAAAAIFGIQRHFAVVHALPDRSSAAVRSSSSVCSVRSCLRCGLLACRSACSAQCAALLPCSADCFRSASSSADCCLLLLIQHRNTLALFGKLRIHALHLLGAVCAPAVPQIFLLAVADVRLNNRLTAGSCSAGKLLGFSQPITRRRSVSLSISAQDSASFARTAQPAFLLLFCIRQAALSQVVRSFFSLAVSNS